MTLDSNHFYDEEELRNREHSYAWQWLEKNPAYCRQRERRANDSAHDRNRQCFKFPIVQMGHILSGTISQLLLEQAGMCNDCGTAFRRLHWRFEIDHIQPIVKGGTNELSNLQLLCYPCNRFKGAEWAESEEADLKRDEELLT